MITVVSDTHGLDDHRLTGRTLAAVREADLVVHAGDFTRGPVLDAVYDESERLFAVYGNSDDATVRDRLPETRTFERGGVRFALTHRREGGAMGLSLFGREQGADVVVSGHSHRPRAIEAKGVLLLNPGSYADPRGNRPAHAELVVEDGVLEGELVDPDGTVFETVTVETD